MRVRILCSVVIIGVLAFATVSGYLCVEAIKGIATGIQTSQWTQTRGHIVRWDVKHYLSGPVGTRIQLDCEYDYCVNGRQLTNTRVVAYRLTKNDIYKIGFLSPGATHDVFYNPLNPEEAVLIRGAKYSSLLAYMVSHVSACVFLYGLWLNREDIRRFSKSKWAHSSKH